MKWFVLLSFTWFFVAAQGEAISYVDSHMLPVFQVLSKTENFSELKMQYMIKMTRDCKFDRAYVSLKIGKVDVRQLIIFDLESTKNQDEYLITLTGLSLLLSPQHITVVNVCSPLWETKTDI